MPVSLPVPGDTVGTWGPLLNAWLRGVTPICVTDTAYGGAAGDGVTDDTAAIQAALNAATPGQAVYMPASTYKTTSVLTIPSGVSLYGPSRTMAIPTGSYGLGGVPLQGAIIQPAGSVTAAVQFASNASTQYGNQRLLNVTLDGSNMTSGTGHGILADAAAGITLRDVTVYNTIGDGLHANPVSGTGNHPPDFWDITGCKFSNCGGWGASLNGLADSFITNCEATGNRGGGGWSVTNCNNTRFMACKGEQNSAGPGWLFTAAAGFTGIVHVLACTAQFNNQDGFRITGPGAGTYQIIGCSADSDGTNGGSGGGGFAGLNVSSFPGTVLADGFNCRVTGSPAAPQYGVTAASSGVVTVDAASVAGATAAVNDGGGNAALLVRSGAAERMPTASQMGILAWNYPSILAMGGTAAAASGTVYLIRVPLPGGTSTITNILLAVQTAGSTLTSGENFAGVYDSTGTKIGGTADQTTPWGSTGLKTMALSGGPFTTSSPYAYVVFVSNGTTPPQFARIGGGTNVGPLSTLSSSGSSMPFATNGTGTALPASLTYASNSATSAQPFWAGLS